METIKEQYNLVVDARAVVLEYLKTIKPHDIKKPVESFNESSLLSMMLHIANTYLFWLKRFAAKEEFEYFEDTNINNIEGIISAFAEADKVVYAFMDSHKDINAPIEGEIFWLKKNMTYSVLELFTHVVTHEFHHKGQVMSMSRILGYTPPHADIIWFN